MTTRIPSHLSEADLARLRRKLEDIRASLLATELGILHEQEAIEPVPADSIDAAERTFEQEASLQRTSADAALISEVDHALAKLEAGGYGFSEESGEPIELERLEAVPWARHTAAEEERHEIVDRGAPRHATA